MGLVLTIVSQEIENLSAGSAPIDPEVTGETTGSIGALYELRLVLSPGGTTTGGLPITSFASSVLYFNPALFTEPGFAYGFPAQGYIFKFGATLSGGPYTMGLVGCGVNTEPNRNETVKLYDVGGGDLELRFRFRMTCDVGLPIIGAALPNRSRLLRARVVDGTDLVNTSNSVYRGARQLYWMMRWTSPNATQWTGTDAYRFSSRFYDQALNASPLVEAGHPTIEMLRDGIPVTNLSVFGTTSVRMRWDKVAAWDIDPTCELFFMDTTQQANAGQTYIDQYGGTGWDTATLTDGGTYWELLFDVTPSMIVYQRIYGLAVVLKLQDTGSSDRITNSFIKHPMPADALPNSIGLTDQVTGTIKDYNVDPLFDNVITTIHDRLNFRIEVNRTAYNAQVSTLLGLGQTWAQGFNADLRKVWFVMQEEATLAPAGPNTYTPFSNLVNTIPGLQNAVQVIESGDIVAFEFPHLRMSPYWLNTDLLVTWKLEFYYPDLDWTVLYTYQQRVRVKDYKGFTDVIQSLTITDAETGQPVLTMCETTRLRILVKLNPAIAGDYDWNIRAVVGALDAQNPNILVINSGTSTEEEAYDSPIGSLPTRTSPYIDVFGDLVGPDMELAIFLDGTFVDEGEKWCVGVIAERVYDPCEVQPAFPSTMRSVDYALHAGNQAMVEGASLPIGTRILVTGHGVAWSGGFPNTTLWERNTGNIMIQVAPGTGVEGTMWNVEVVPAGTVVDDLSWAGGGVDYPRYHMVLTDYYYYNGGTGTGKASIFYLWRPGPVVGAGNTSYVPLFADLGNIQPSHQTHNPGVIQDGSMDEADYCRVMIVEYTTDADPLTATWATAPDTDPQRLEAGNTSVGWLLYLGNYVLTVPPGTTYIRSRWERGGHLQGYSQAIAV